MSPLLLASALLLDLLQLGISLALTAALTPVLGGILGFVISVCTSVVFGSGLIFGVYLTASNARPNAHWHGVEARIIRRMLIFAFGETLPVVNNIPLWTISTALALQDIRKEVANDDRQSAGAETEEESDEGEDDAGEEAEAPREELSPVTTQDEGGEGEERESSRTRPRLSFDGVRPRQNNKKAA